ncbi:hypothetical protein ABPG77_009878 [Micractinium sp. CCAP 211/92]
MSPLSLALAACPAVLYASLSPPSAGCARPQALRRSLGARWRQAASLQAAASTDGRGVPEAAFPTASGTVGASGGSRSQDGEGAGGIEPSQLVLSRRGKMVAVPPGLEAQLAPLAHQCGCSLAALSRAVAAEDKPRQAGMVQHGAAVAAWLRSQGISDAQLQRLLLRCPVLFSRPVEQRAGMLLGQLQGLGLSAAEAARCFESQPAAAGSTSFAPAIGVLAELFAAGSKGSGPAEQLGSFLQKQPAALRLLSSKPEALQQCIDSLLGLGLTTAQLMAAARSTWTVLCLSPARLAALADVLQQELGGRRKLCAKLLHCAPRVVGCSLETVRVRAQALVQVFGQQATLDMVSTAPILLGIDSSVWQTALSVMQLCGLTEEQAMQVARNDAQVLCHNWLAVRLLANRLALQRCLQLTAGQVYMRHAGYAADHSAERLAGRLLFLQHHGLLRLLVAEKKELLQQWRHQHGLRAGRLAPGEPSFISLRDVCRLKDSQFASLPAVQAAGGLPALQAFLAELDCNPAWQELQAAAAAEQARLLALVPPDLRQAASRRQQAAEHSKKNERGWLCVVD